MSLTMGTNVAGRALMINSAATGASGEGAAIDITHSGNLSAGADLFNITSTGSISSTSNLMAIEHSTGACVAGCYGLYINVTGANIEAIKVDAGNVVFDEDLSVGGALGVTGAVTLSDALGVSGLSTLSTVLYKDLTEVVAATNIISAAETGSVFFLNNAVEFASTLPAPAAGLHYTFIVTASPAGASYTITTNAAAAVILGSVVTAEDAGGSSAATADTPITTITLADGQANTGDRVEVWCDGTYWYAACQAELVAGITFA